MEEKKGQPGGDRLKNGEILSRLLHREGRMDAGWVLKLMRPVLKTLADSHRSGQCMFRISPEYIWVYNEVWFCFALSEERMNKSPFQRDKGTGIISLLWEPWSALVTEQAAGVSGQPDRYAAAELYISEENGGTWSDVYSVCAVMYRAMTGIVPQRACDRMMDDLMPPLSELGVQLPAGQQAALEKGFSILAKDRYQDGAELYAALYPHET